MSRGPGRRMRALLAAAEAADGEWVTLDEVGGATVGAPLTPSDREALRRAARGLADAGLLEVSGGRRSWDRHYVMTVRSPGP